MSQTSSRRCKPGEATARVRVRRRFAGRAGVFDIEHKIWPMASFLEPRLLDGLFQVKQISFPERARPRVRCSAPSPNTRSFSKPRMFSLSMRTGIIHDRETTLKSPAPSADISQTCHDPQPVCRATVPTGGRGRFPVTRTLFDPGAPLRAGCSPSLWLLASTQPFRTLSLPAPRQLRPRSRSSQTRLTSQAGSFPPPRHSSSRPK